MPLTPSDVSNKLFDKAFRGYAMDEVDAFLDEVEGELTRLLTDRAELQSRVGAAGSAAVAAGPEHTTPAGPEKAQAAEPMAPTQSAETTSDVPPATQAVESTANQSFALREREEPQEAALRTLLMAQRTADQAIAEARAEAEAWLAEARTTAEGELAQARSEAELLLEQSRLRAQELDQQVQDRTAGELAALQVREGELAARIEQMRAFEREYRLRLKAYLESQLRDLEAGPSADSATQVGVGASLGTGGQDDGTDGTAQEPSAAPQPLGPFSSDPTSPGEPLRGSGAPESS